MKTEIYLVRHGEAEGNVYRRIHGQYDSLLTPNGFRQLQALEQRFASIPVDACYASDLTRTSLTAGAIYKPKHLPLHRDARFREVGLGRWEDVPFGYLHRFETEAMKQFDHDPARWHVEGAERFKTYTDRFFQGMEEAIRENEGKTVAIVSHGCVLRGVLLRLFFDPAHPKLPHCDNTAVSHLFYEDGQYSYDYINDNSHLSAEISTRARQSWWRDGNVTDFNLWFQPLTDGQQFVSACHQAEQQTGRNTPEDVLLGYFSMLRQQGEVMSAMLADQPIGTVAARVSQRHPDAAVLELLTLAEEYRGKRYGTQLLGQAVSYTRRMAKKRLMLQVNAANTQAIGFYEHSGFDKIGCVEGKPEQWVMERNLDPDQFIW